MVDHIMLDGGDEDDTRQAAAQPQAAPQWPPNNTDVSTWPAPPWPAHKMKPAGLKVEEKYSLYLTYSESDLERKRDSFLKELRQPAGSLDRTFGSGPFTFRDNTWIQLEAIRRVLNGRKGGDAKFFSVRHSPPPSLARRLHR